VGGHLREVFELSKKFSLIARRPVRVYFNNKSKRYELWHRNYCIQGIMDKGIDGSVPEVRDHFRKLISGYYQSSELKETVVSARDEADRKAELLIEEKAKDDEKDFEKALRGRITISGC